MSQFQRNAATYEVKFDGAVNPDARVISIAGTTGGRSLDYAVIQFFDVPREEGVQTNAPLVNFTQAICEIIKIDDAGNRERVHWGQVCQRSVEITDSESQHVTSRIEPWHFGVPIGGQIIFDPITKKVGTNNEPVVFNQEMDGRIWQTLLVRPGLNIPLFLHPDCQRTTVSSLANGGIGIPWQLPSAAYYLCLAGNEAQKHIENPSLVELTKVLSLDLSILRNHRQPYGGYLPAHLDALLEPYGYGWCVDPVQLKIVVHKRGF